MKSSFLQDIASSFVLICAAGAMLFGPRFASAQDLSSDLAAHWRFDEAPTERALDSSGNGLHIELSRPVWVDGKIGKALSFDGTIPSNYSGANQFLKVPSVDLSAASQVTISVWLNHHFSAKMSSLFSSNSYPGPNTFVFNVDDVDPYGCDDARFYAAEFAAKGSDPAALLSAVLADDPRTIWGADVITKLNSAVFDHAVLLAKHPEVKPTTQIQKMLDDIAQGKSVSLRLLSRLVMELCYPTLAPNPQTRMQLSVARQSSLACYLKPKSGVWHHYVAILDKSTATKQVDLYIDGVLQTPLSRVERGVTGYFTNSPIYLMWSSFFTAPITSGELDDVRIYKRRLSSSEIQQLYQSGQITPDTISPTVSMTTPADNASVSGFVHLSASASDNSGKAFVQFKVDGDPVGRLLSKSPFAFSWDSRGVANGTHVVSAEAVDAAGNLKASRVMVDVKNPVPPLPAGTVQWPVVRSVTEFGAKGDAMRLMASTVAGSATISIDDDHRFSFSPSNPAASPDIGKVVLLFGVGPATVSSNQDLITTIVSVQDEHHATLAIAPSRTAAGVRAMIGTQNSQAFQRAVDSVDETKGTILYVPAGQYLLIPPQMLDPRATVTSPYSLFYAVKINKAGIRFQGEDRTKSVLIGNGAWNLKGDYLERGVIFGAMGPIKGDKPLEFANLTFDGGVAEGCRVYHGWPADAKNGDGWDVTHAALIDTGASLHRVKRIQNCAFVHWRGEILKSVTSMQDNYIEVKDSIFKDGNASAFNLSFTHLIDSCVFDDIEMAMEFYLGYTKGDNRFVNSKVTNVRVGLVLVGAETRNTRPTYTIEGNQIEGITTGVMFSPAPRLTVRNNRFTGSGTGLGSYGAAYQAQAPWGDYNYNILVEGNLFENATSGFHNGGGGMSRIDGIVVRNNIKTNGNLASAWGTEIRNDVFTNNFATGEMGGDGRQTEYFYDDGSNNFTPRVQTATNTTPKGLSYLFGRSQHIKSSIASGASFYIDDAEPAKIPFNVRNHLDPAAPLGRAIMAVTNVWTSPLPVYTTANTSGATPISIPAGQELQVAWNGTAWEHLAGPQFPPTASLTSPGNGSSFQERSSITVSVDAKDSDGSIAKVEIFADYVNKIATLTAAPYTYTWRPAAPGTHQLQARVADNSGSLRYTERIAVTVMADPRPSTQPKAPSNLRIAD